MESNATSLAQQYEQDRLVIETMLGEKKDCRTFATIIRSAVEYIRRNKTDFITIGVICIIEKNPDGSPGNPKDGKRLEVISSIPCQFIRTYDVYIVPEETGYTCFDIEVSYGSGDRDFRGCRIGDIDAFLMFMALNKIFMKNVLSILQEGSISEKVTETVTNLADSTKEKLSGAAESVSGLFKGLLKAKENKE